MERMEMCAWRGVQINNSFHGISLLLYLAHHSMKGGRRGRKESAKNQNKKLLSKTRARLYNLRVMLRGG